MIRASSAVSISLCTCALVSALACSSDAPEKPTATDAGAAPVVVDAGTASAPGAIDAGAAPVVVDAGAASAPVVDAGAASAKGESAPAGKASVFDRILVKPKDAAMSKDAAVAAAEKATGAKIGEARKSVRVWYLLVFAPTEPARTAADQAKLVAQLKDAGVFASVEGDAVMKLK
jgi:hypothetical protein